MNAPDSNWRELLDLALPALDHVYGKSEERSLVPSWTLGGGTALAIQIDHRISYDIGLFVAGVPLRRFTPAQNPAAKLISLNFRWPGHYLKFERPEGEIDFLSPPLQTEPGFLWMDYRDRRIAIESLEEVIVKKIRYRSSRFTARDVYDLAAVSEARPGLATLLAEAVPNALARTRDVVDLHVRRGLGALEAAIVVTARGTALLPLTFEIAQTVLDEAAGLVT